MANRFGEQQIYHFKINLQKLISNGS